MISWVLKSDSEISRLTAWREFPRLRQKLDAGKPAVLLLVRTHGLQNPTLNHQVAALGYQLDPKTRAAEIYIYDPNHPGQDRTLTMNLASAAGDWDLKIDGDEPLRGFFLQNYRPKSPPKPGI
jgi:hypothetical protein